MKFLDAEHPWLIPLWRRVAVLAVCLVWAALEWATGAPFWGMIALGFSGYAVWALFVDFDVERARSKGK